MHNWRNAMDKEASRITPRLLALVAYCQESEVGNPNLNARPPSPSYMSAVLDDSASAIQPVCRDLPCVPHGVLWWNHNKWNGGAAAIL